MSAEQKEKDLKIKRRTAKAKLTRLLNALQKLLDSNRNLDEVTESLQNLELAYKDLEEKHEAYCEIIEDDEQFLKEGTWLEECQSSFMDMQIKVKDCIKAKASEASERAETPPAVNVSSNVASPERPDESDSPQVESAFRVQVERPKLPRFGGDVRVYSTFKSDFHHLIDRYSKRDAMTILRTALHGKPLELIRGIGNDYDEAWALLDSIYGDPRLVADVIVDEMERFPPLKEGDDARFCDLVHIVMRSYNTLKEVGRTGDMDNSHMLALVERKMTSNDRKVWFRYLQRDRQEATFEALRTWMSGEMKMRLRASAPLRDARSSTQQKDKRSSASVSHIAEEDKSGKQADYKCWICKSSDHWVDQCKKLLSKSQPERFQMMKDNHACYSCLKRAGRDHNMKTCKRRKRCTEKLNGEQCTSFHHPLLHKETAREIVASVSGKTALLPVVTVTMMGFKDQSYSANCLLDSGAQISLVRRSVAENLGLKGKPISINITKVGCVTEEVQTKIYRLRLRSLDDNRVYRVSAVGLDSINDDIVQVQTDGLCKTFNLGQNCLHRSSGSIDVLVGIDHAKLHTGETRQKGNLVARHTPLGWVVFGADPDHQAAKNTVLNVMVTDAVDLKDFWTTESMGVCHGPSQYQQDGLSRQEMDESKLISDSCQKVGKQWLVPYPWQKEPDLLPDNKAQAERMLYATERKLAKNPNHADAYDRQIQEMVEMKFARKLSKDEVRLYEGPVHYIAHHAVVRPEKQSTPIRIVFNSSASYQGHSLNDYWMKGPDLLNRLFGVLMRFREHEVALCADISKMYHRVMIPERDQHVHRFLWRNLNQDKQPDVYIMRVVTFGDKPSPAMAQTALRKTAEEGAKMYPKAASTIMHDTYMDDICASVPTVTEAEELSRSIDKVLADGGFKVKGWRSNKEFSRGHDGNAEKPRLLKTITDEKVLGVVWENDSDTFSYKVKLNEDAIQAIKMTKRSILSQVARIFDPIGFATPIVIRAKIGLQRLWEEGLNWDDELPEESQTEWRKLFREMEKLTNVRFQRCLTPTNARGKPTLCIFCDASMEAFGACAYLRWEVDEARYEVRFVTAKSRVAPLKQLTIPRLELQAAVLASRLYTTIRTEMSLDLADVIFMTDSMITLSWVKSKARSYKMFVAVRVGEIQTATDPSKWRHIPGELNVADDLSRGLDADQLTARWQHGPDFLREPMSDWPEEGKAEEKMPEMEKEMRKEQSVLNITQLPDEDVIDCAKFSSWRKLIRVTSYVLRFLRKLKAKCKRETDESEKDTDCTLTPDDLQKGENFLIEKAQQSLKARVDKGELKTLSPYTDETGIIRVGGRVDKAEMSFEMKHPVLLPYEHWISTLITRHFHESGHNGVAVTTAKARRRYWILKGHNLAKTVKFRCTVCRAFDHKTETQEMADLPTERLSPHTPPFHYTACDYFGPFQVRVGRNKTAKNYGVLFTCLNSRAVHLELATDCSTMEFLQVLRRFFAIRGQPGKILSDNGTQFIGAQRELRDMVRGWSKEELREFCAEKGTEWTFTTPAAPHQNGSAESLVKSCKYALKRAIGEQILTPFELYTCLLEVANLVNQRPIGRIPTDPDDGNYLCPNDMLLGRASSDVAQGPFRETRNPRHRVEFIQRIVDTFWHRWTRDVLPLLAPRQKWHVDRRNVRVDDVAMMADANAVRGKWTIARVIQVYPGPDGKVRNVKVKMPTAEYRRLVTKIAVIYPAEGYDE
ncbi:uncharacterized protein [Diadema antillarum]|uniref:uncharacterized protein n=1 Tax=Diadema antillarum TaxID=105358 RepID=UPI003A850FFB